MLTPESQALDIAAALEHFRTHGYARLGKVASDETLELLRKRADEIMMGEVAYDGLFFQMDSVSGTFRELVFGRGWEGPSLNYRKIEKLEKDPLYRAWLTNPLFESIARTVIDEPTITLYRALIMNKSAIGGTHLPWHQDGGQFWGLDRDPQLQIWTALDDAPAEAGCLEMYPGSHAYGLATPLGGVVPHDRVAERNPAGKTVSLPVVAGEAVLIHNYMWHRSGVNTTGKPRRGFTACFMAGSTRCQRKKRAPRAFPVVFGALPTA